MSPLRCPNSAASGDDSGSRTHLVCTPQVCTLIFPDPRLFSALLTPFIDRRPSLFHSHVKPLRLLCVHAQRGRQQTGGISVDADTTGSRRRRPKTLSENVRDVKEPSPIDATRKEPSQMRGRYKGSIFLHTLHYPSLKELLTNGYLT